MRTHSIAWAALVALSLFVQAAPASAQSSTCVATSAAPTYTNGALKALSCELDGDLRVVTGGGSSGGTSSTFGAAFPADGTAIGFSNGTNMVAGTVNGAGDIEVVLPTALPAGTNNIGDVDVLTLPSIPTGANVIGAVTQSGTWNIGTVTTVTAVTAISNALPAGNNNIGDVDAIQSGTWTVQPGNTANTTPWLTTNVPPTTTADTLLSSTILANSTNATNVKASAGTVYNISVTNNSATIAYLKMYNSASAPTCGSGTPVARYIIPASTAGAGSNIDFAVGAEYTTGIGYCVTTGITDADTTAVAASAYIVNIVYK